MDQKYPRMIIKSDLESLIQKEVVKLIQGEKTRNWLQAPME